MKSLRESLVAEKEQKAKLEKVRYSMVDLLYGLVWLKLKLKLSEPPETKWPFL